VICAVSASSPWVSLALLTREGTVLFSNNEKAETNASYVLSKLWEEAKSQFPNLQLEGIVADIGPGSFIGTRVGVVFAKMLAFGLEIGCAGLNAFDLTAPTEPVAIPNKRGEYFLREPGSLPRLIQGEPPAELLGYAPGIASPTYPRAKNAAHFAKTLVFESPALLRPEHLVNPSISTPKTPYRTQ
jgi:tRNA A37 threonylcarbamoyladenosine modification protein TsaB